jgi:hypothetical protein
VLTALPNAVADANGRPGEYGSRHRRRGRPRTRTAVHDDDNNVGWARRRKTEKWWRADAASLYAESELPS